MREKSRSVENLAQTGITKPLNFSFFLLNIYAYFSVIPLAKYTPQITGASQLKQLRQERGCQIMLNYGWSNVGKKRAMIKTTLRARGGGIGSGQRPH